ncbi:hypothetical protein VNO77_19581 [Canavalia gladiata]|uniref:Uncharacterized protein n=1 Tax=Canavalia gladiata TaxID=3824 RepID=A0AAN9LRT4_CANGL
MEHGCPEMMCFNDKTLDLELVIQRAEDQIKQAKHQEAKGFMHALASQTAHGYQMHKVLFGHLGLLFDTLGSLPIRFL